MSENAELYFKMSLFSFIKATSEIVNLKAIISNAGKIMVKNHIQERFSGLDLDYINEKNNKILTQTFSNNLIKNKIIKNYNCSIADDTELNISFLKCSFFSLCKSFLDNNGNPLFEEKILFCPHIALLTTMIKQNHKNYMTNIEYTSNEDARTCIFSVSFQ